MKEKDIIDAYCEIRRTNNTIPDEVLDFMKESSLVVLESSELPGDRIEIKTIVPGYDTITIPKPTGNERLGHDLKLLVKIVRVTGRCQTADWIDDQISNYEFFKKQYNSSRKKMKKRLGFVSNSSSSSFVVRNFTEEQKQQILEFNDAIGYDRWSVFSMTDDFIKFSTFIDNFPYHADCTRYQRGECPCDDHPEYCDGKLGESWQKFLDGLGVEHEYGGEYFEWSGER